MSERAFHHNLSPLDVLEHNSRRLASRLQKDPQGRGPNLRVDTSGRQHPPQESQGPQQHSQGPSVNPENLSDIMRQPSNASSASIRVRDSMASWNPDALNRHASISSVASIGGILDSFRLSSLPISQYGDDVRHTIRPISGYSQDGDHHNDDYNDTSDVATIQESPQSTQSPHTQLTEPQSAQSASSSNSNSSSHFNNTHKPATTPTAVAASDNAITRSTSHTSQGPPSPDKPPLSPASSVASETSMYSALSSFSPKPKRPPMNSRQSQSQYYFPDLSRARSPNSSSDRARSPQPNNAGGLLVPPPLRSQRSHSQNPPPPDDVLNKMFKDMTLEEHVTVGIYMHERGDLREASYHWQYSAFKGDATAMLLYGLALRHGWGMRQNATEAVKWLRKAMESSLGDSAAPTAGGLPSIIPSDDNQGSKIKKAHIGLALYELGMSYLHSWGTEKDEDMALRSFELAGQLGDSDALCEAAALYMHNGPKGRKKDLQKAAKLYRQAAERGANMVGQSWIYKDKYMDTKDKKKKKK
uniref:ARAD1A08184p n=1 Tax=Blastobotrys adeninivorans TaxID=409370 RepID=A0A060SXC1_BLAAD